MLLSRHTETNTRDRLRGSICVPTILRGENQQIFSRSSAIFRRLWQRSLRNSTIYRKSETTYITEYLCMVGHHVLLPCHV